MPTKENLKKEKLMNKKIKILMVGLVLLLGGNVNALNWDVPVTGFKARAESVLEETIELSPYLYTDPNTALRILDWQSEIRVIGQKTFNGLTGMYFAILDANNNMPGLRVLGTALYFQKNIRFIRFNRQTANGGAIFAQGNSTVNFKNVDLTEVFSTVKFENNKALQGGAIHALSANVYFLYRIVNFANNEASSAGAVYTSKMVDFRASYVDFVGNRATNHGGAIFALGANVNFIGLEDVVLQEAFSSTTFRDNIAEKNGGAVFSERSTFNFINTIAAFDNNHAGINGGAIFSERSSFSFINAIAAFDNNRAERNGGAIYAGSSSFKFTNSELNFTNNTSNNTASSYYDGGGAIFAGNSSINFDNSTVNFTNNTSNNTASPYYDGGGGAILAERSTVNFTNSALNFTNNTSNNSNSYESSNRGGAIYANNSYINVRNSTASFTNNSGDYGGAIYVVGSTVNFRNSAAHFTNNTSNNSDSYVSNSGGGAIYANNSYINVRKSTLSFTNNVSNRLSGAIFAVGSSINFRNSAANFINNNAYGSGAIHLVNSRATFEDPMFVNNRSLQDEYYYGEYRKHGGAITLHSSEIIIRAVNRDVIFSNNKSNNSPNDIAIIRDYDYASANSSILFDVYEDRKINLQGGIFFAGFVDDYYYYYDNNNMKITKTGPGELILSGRNKLIGVDLEILQGRLNIKSGELFDVYLENLNIAANSTYSTIDNSALQLTTATAAQIEGTIELDVDFTNMTSDKLVIMETLTLGTNAGFVINVLGYNENRDHYIDIVTAGESITGQVEQDDRLKYSLYRRNAKTISVKPGNLLRVNDNYSDIRQLSENEAMFLIVQDIHLANNEVTIARDAIIYGDGYAFLGSPNEEGSYYSGIAIGAQYPTANQTVEINNLDFRDFQGAAISVNAYYECDVNLIIRNTGDKPMVFANNGTDLDAGSAVITIAPITNNIEFHSGIRGYSAKINKEGAKDLIITNIDLLAYSDSESEVNIKEGKLKMISKPNPDPWNPQYMRVRKLTVQEEGTFDITNFSGGNITVDIAEIHGTIQISAGDYYSYYYDNGNKIKVTSKLILGSNPSWDIVGSYYDFLSYLYDSYKLRIISLERDESEYYESDLEIIYGENSGGERSYRQGDMLLTYDIVIVDERTTTAQNPMGVYATNFKLISLAPIITSSSLTGSFIANAIRQAAISDNSLIYSNVGEKVWVAGQFNGGTLADEDNGDFGNSDVGAKAGWTFVGGDGFSLGAFAGFASRAYKQGSNEATGTAMDFGLYGGFGLGGNVSLAGFAGYGLQSVKSDDVDFDAAIIKFGFRAEYLAGLISPFVGFEGAMVNAGDIDLGGATLEAASYTRMAGQVGIKIGRRSWYIKPYVDLLLAGNKPEYSVKSDEEGAKSMTVYGTEESAAAFGLGAGFSVPVSGAADIFAGGDIKMNAEYFGYQANVGVSFRFSGKKIAKAVDMPVKAEVVAPIEVVVEMPKEEAVIVEVEAAEEPEVDEQTIEEKIAEITEQLNALRKQSQADAGEKKPAPKRQGRRVRK